MNKGKIMGFKKLKMFKKNEKLSKINELNEDLVFDDKNQKTETKQSGEKNNERGILKVSTGAIIFVACILTAASIKYYYIRNPREKEVPQSAVTQTEKSIQEDESGCEKK